MVVSCTRSNAGLPIAGALALLAATSGAPRLAHAQPSPQAGKSGVYMRYLNAPQAGDDLREPPHLTMSFGGRKVRAVMDTGSTGIVVSATSIPGIDQLPNRGPGTLTYTSSGRIMQGDWVVTPVTIAGANGASVTTAPVVVLAVRTVRCTETARSCTQRDNPRGVAMIGIGFGRKRKPEDVPDKNPFLNVPGMGIDGLRRGYVITRAGVQVGLTDANSKGDYVTVALRRDEELGDWTGAPACISIDDRAPAACGTVLPDTGVTRMFLALPAAQTDGNTLPAGGDQTLTPGTKITISLAPGAPKGSGSAEYSFSVGDVANPLAPPRVTLVGRGERPPYVNTSVYLLNGFDYLFDADRGIVGYRRTRAAAR